MSQSKTVLITGASGFIGGHVSRDLVLGGFDVHASEHINENPEWVTSHHCDLRYPDEVLAMVNAVNPDIVVHLASQPIVQAGEEFVRYTFECNVQGTLNLYDALLGLDKTPVFIGASCYDPETRALTVDGLKRYDEISVGDDVLSVNPETGEIEKTKVKEVIVEDYFGDMISFNSRSVDLLVTPNHKMWTRYKNRIVFQRADDEIPSSGMPHLYGEWVGGSEVLPVQPSHKWNTKKMSSEFDIRDVLYLLGVYIGDGVIQHQEKKVKTKTGLSHTEAIRTNRDAKTGRFGKAVDKQIEATTTSNTLFFYIPRNDPCRHDVEAALTRLGIEWHDWEHGGEGAIWCTSVELCYWFKDAGLFAENKLIPSWALDQPQENLLWLLCGIMDSDGDKRSHSVVTTVSTKLVEDLIELGMKCGFHTTFSSSLRNKNPKIDGREIRQNFPAYYVKFSKQNKSIRRESRKVVHNYRGKIWCLRLEKNKNFLVERNGKTMISGNTDKVYGRTGQLPYTEDHELRGNEQAYETSKTMQDHMMQYYSRYFPTIITRCSNVYGPGDTHESRIVPHAIKSYLQGKSPTVRSNGQQYRDYMFIDDVVYAYRACVLRALEMNSHLEIYNFGTGVPSRVLDVVSMVREHFVNSPAPEVLYGASDEISKQYNSYDRANQVLGWLPSTKLKEGISKTIDWWRTYERD